jgi:hypothetical protein
MFVINCQTKKWMWMFCVYQLVTWSSRGGGAISTLPLIVYVRSSELDMILLSVEWLPWVTLALMCYQTVDSANSEKCYKCLIINYTGNTAVGTDSWHVGLPMSNVSWKRKQGLQTLWNKGLSLFNALLCLTGRMVSCRSETVLLARLIGRKFLLKWLLRKYSPVSSHRCFGGVDRLGELYVK